MDPVPPEWWIDYMCNLTGGWDAFAANAGSTITTSDDGLWMPMTDERIRAVMPMAPEGAWLFGERGLEAVDRPTLIVGATQDETNIYGLEAAYIFDHIRPPDPVMVSFVGQNHMMVYDPIQVARMSHFAVAFFGHHLQGREDFARYFSEDFVTQYDDLAWGVYQE
jgi:predicted dienelactone hydrolase